MLTFTLSVSVCKITSATKAVSGNVWPLHMTKPLGLLVALGNGLSKVWKSQGERWWQQCNSWEREGLLKGCWSLLKGWGTQGFLGRKKYCSFTHPRHHLPAPEWWRMVSHGVKLVEQLESLPAIIQLQVLKSLGQRQFSLLYLFSASGCGGLKSWFQPQSTPTGQTSREAAALQGAKPESDCEKDELLGIGIITRGLFPRLFFLLKQKGI